MTILLQKITGIWLFLCFLSIVSYAQHTPHCIYRITNVEARSIQERGLQPGDTAFFHDRISCAEYYDTDQLPYGHYLKVKAAGNQLVYTYIPRAPWDITILDNSTDLILQYSERDASPAGPSGRPRLSYGNKNIPYDSTIACHRLRHPHQGKLLTVTQGGHTFYYGIKRTEHNSRWSKLRRGVMFRSPIKYIAGPAIFVGHIPPDVIRSIKKGYTSGVITDLTKAGNNLLSVFRRADSQPRQDYWATGRKYSSYFFFSKPKYREKDTIRFKAYLYKKSNQKWLTKTLSVYLGYGKDSHYLGKAKPLRKGDGYVFSFVIADSMNIRLDRPQFIQLKTSGRHNAIAYGEFRYENYQLQKSVFTVELPQTQKDSRYPAQMRNVPFEIKLTARDDNDLPLPEAKAEICLTTEKVEYAVPDMLFVPDTLWQYQTTITGGAQRLLIPDSIFPQANLRYNLSVLMSNSDGETSVRKKSVNFENNSSHIDIKIVGDSLYLNTTGNDITGKVQLLATDAFYQTLSDTLVSLPYHTHINLYAQSYEASADSMESILELDKIEPELRPDWIRTSDSLFVNLVNPGKIPVVYHLFKKDTEVRSGTGTTCFIRLAAKEKETYRLLIEYIWAGRARALETSLSAYASVVNLNVEQPPVIYPGQETEITITATDQKDRPLSGVNLLTFGFTGKFGEPREEQRLPYLGKDVTVLPLTNRFTLNHEYPTEKTTSLNFSFWNKVMQLDSSKKYKLLYPSRRHLQLYSSSTAEHITQFALFPVQEGRILPVQYVILDSLPVYFGFTDEKVPYSFPITAGLHQVKLRTPGHLITVRDFAVQPGVKTIAAIDLDGIYPGITIERHPDILTTEEQKKLSPFIMSYDPTSLFFNNAYLSNSTTSDIVIPLGPFRKYEYVKTIGPLVWRNWTFNDLDGFSLPFTYEPFYCYSFGRTTLKMTSIEQQALMPVMRWQVPSFDDSVQTKAELNAYYNRQLDHKRITQTPPQNDTFSGACNLSLELSRSGLQDKLLNILLFQPDNFSFIRVAAGNTRQFSYLTEGHYELVLVTSDNVYLKSKTLTIRSNGRNFYKAMHLDTLKGSRVQKINRLLRELYTYNPGNSSATAELMNIYVSVINEGHMNLVSGQVKDENGEPAPGVSVIIRSTKMGTVTDLDGNYTLEIPQSLLKPELVFKSIGLEDRIVPVRYPRTDVEMEPSANFELSGVEIYGSAIEKRSYTGALSHITTREISKPVTDIIKALDGHASGVQVSYGQDGEREITIPGRSFNPADSDALLVINGAVFNGTLTLNVAAIASTHFLQGKTATALYGTRGANGVILITTKPGVLLPEHIRKGLETLPDPEPEGRQGGLRQNFRDEAFWQPQLVTDVNGKASFRVRFPDDITAWRTYVYATDKRKHTGQSSGLIKSYRKVSASLPVPAFLLQGDITVLLGQLVNYRTDTLPLTATFYRNDTLQATKAILLHRLFSDTLPLYIPSCDSIRLRYMITADDGYTDGEQRTIPVGTIGIPAFTGSFLPLYASDTIISLEGCTGSTDTLFLSAVAGLDDIAAAESRIVADYEYLCNEQLASKIRVALSTQKRLQAQGKTIPGKIQRQTQDMINKLLDRGNTQKGWGWWHSINSTPWISQHVIQTLLAARNMQYVTWGFRVEEAGQLLYRTWHADTTAEAIQAVALMHQTRIGLPYEAMVQELEQLPQRSPGKLRLILLRQQLGLPYNTDLVKTTQKQDMLGNIYWAAGTQSSIHDNDITVTLTALKILQADNGLAIPKDRVVNWLLQQRTAAGWQNTYESALILEALYPYLASGNNNNPANLSFSGAYRKEVTRFPFSGVVTGKGPIDVRKRGDAPVYFTWYRKFRDTSKEASGNSFAVHSSFSQGGREVSQLQQGTPATLEVKVNVFRNASFVKIEIPIPAGCTYFDKRQYNSAQEVYREYRDHKVSIFCQSLPEGEYRYQVNLLPRFRGHYTLNPASACLMYFPAFSGRSEIKRVFVR